MGRQVRIDSTDPFFQYGVHLSSRIITLETSDDGEITPTTAAKFVKGFHLLQEISSDPVTVWICSIGGDVNAGFAIYDAIRQAIVYKKMHVTTVAKGEALSMAAIILQAGIHRVAEANAEIMLHAGSVTIAGTAQDVERSAAADKKTRERLYQVLAHRTEKPASFFRKRLATDWYLTANEALDEDIVDEVV